MVQLLYLYLASIYFCILIELRKLKKNMQIFESSPHFKIYFHSNHVLQPRSHNFVHIKSLFVAYALNAYYKIMNFFQDVESHARYTN